MNPEELERAGIRAPATYARGSWLFVRALGAVHVLAFLSFDVQLEGLVGSQGLFPAADALALAEAQGLGFMDAPSVAWWARSDLALHAICWIGATAGALAALGRFPRVMLATCWAAYLSLFPVADRFFGYQWDTLLCEATLVAIPLATRGAPHRIARYAALFLLFRLMFASGVVKLSSGDPTWRDLSALQWHFWTQPLPGPLSPAADALPSSLLTLMCAAMFAIELAAPWLFFVPGRARRGGALATIALQVGIALTGNYGFFNLLTVALALPLLDDAFLSRWLEAPSSSDCPRSAVLGLSVATMIFGAIPLWGTLAGWRSLPEPVTLTYAALQPWQVANPYGLFAVMTRDRVEIVFEATADGETWHPYVLPFEPGPLTRGPMQVAPHMPRLDWGLWFAALGHPAHEPLVEAVQEALEEANPSVLSLFSFDPMHGNRPYGVRVQRYRYGFDHSRPEYWWHRAPLPDSGD